MSQAAAGTPSLLAQIDPYNRQATAEQPQTTIAAAWTQPDRVPPFPVNRPKPENRYRAALTAASAKQVQPVHPSLLHVLRKEGPSALPAPDAESLRQHGIYALAERGFLAPSADYTPFFEREGLLPRPIGPLKQTAPQAPLGNVTVTRKTDQAVKGEDAVSPPPPPNSPRTAMRATTAEMCRKPHQAASVLADDLLEVPEMPGGVWIPGIVIPRPAQTVYVIQGVVRTDMGSYQHFVRGLHADIVTQISFMLGELAQLMRDSGAAVVQIDLPAVHRLVTRFAFGSRPSHSELLACVVHQEAAKRFCGRPGARFASPCDGRECAAARIQATWRTARQRRIYLGELRRILAARCLQHHWRLRRRTHGFRGRCETLLAQAQPVYTALSQGFAQNYRQLRAKRHIIVHLDSCSAPEETRAAMGARLAQWQLAHTGRVLEAQDGSAHVIVVRPRLSPALVYFYNSLLRAAFPRHFTVEYIVPETGRLMQPSASLAQMLLCSPRALGRLQRAIVNEQNTMLPRDQFIPPPPSSCCFIVPGLVGNDDVRLAAHLGVPVLGPDAQTMARHGSWHGVRQMVRDSESGGSVPFATDLTSEHLVAHAIVRLILENPGFDEWELVSADSPLPYEQAYSRIVTQSVVRALPEAFQQTWKQARDSGVSNISETNLEEWSRALLPQLAELLLLGTASIKHAQHFFAVAFRHTTHGLLLQPCLVTPDVPGRETDLYSRPGTVTASCLIEPDGQIQILGTYELLYMDSTPRPGSPARPQAPTLPALNSHVTDPKRTRPVAPWAALFPQIQYAHRDLASVVRNFCTKLQSVAQWTGHVDVLVGDRALLQNAPQDVQEHLTSNLVVVGYHPYYTDGQSLLQTVKMRAGCRFNKQDGTFTWGLQDQKPPEFHLLNRAQYLDQERAAQAAAQRLAAQAKSPGRVCLYAFGMAHRHLQLMGVTSFLSLAASNRIVYRDTDGVGTIPLPLESFLNAMEEPAGPTMCDTVLEGLSGANEQPPGESSLHWMPARKAGYPTQPRQYSLQTEQDAPSYGFMWIETDVAGVCNLALRTVTALNQILDSVHVKGASNFEAAVCSIVGVCARSEALTRMRRPEDPSPAGPDEEDEDEDGAQYHFGQAGEASHSRRVLPAISGGSGGSRTVTDDAPHLSLKTRVVPTLMAQLRQAASRSVYAYFDRVVMNFYTNATPAFPPSASDYELTQASQCAQSASNRRRSSSQRGLGARRDSLGHSGGLHGRNRDRSAAKDEPDLLLHVPMSPAILALCERTIPSHKLRNGVSGGEEVRDSSVPGPSSD